jgi:SAM-dependent methyltransferase
MHLPEGAHLFRVGESADAFYIILSGSVQIALQLSNGTSGPSKNLIAPALLGVQGMLANAKRKASVVTKEPCQFLKFDRSALKVLHSYLPILGSRIQALAPKLKVRNHSPLKSNALRPKLEHRQYIGGKWQRIGMLQFEFLLLHGLLPSHCLLDIGCGSLRGGVHFIPYLDSGNYLGLDRNQSLIESGIAHELGCLKYAEKNPVFVVSDCFEFNRFEKQPQFSIAQSLFTHLVAKDILLCLKNSRSFVGTGHVLFATFYKGQSVRNPGISDSQKGFCYTLDEMESFGRMTGWKSTYIGDWRHPRSQMMMKYEADQI